MQNLVLLRYDVVPKDLGKLVKKQIFWENLPNNNCYKITLTMWPKPK